MWRWDQQEPFGVNVPDENPSGLGAFEFPLRFPGQYADKETNLHYNMERDYWPEGGRYIQSDPIGLGGGLNLYAYANNDPLQFADPLGLLTVCIGTWLDQGWGPDDPGWFSFRRPTGCTCYWTCAACEGYPYFNDTSRGTLARDPRSRSNSCLCQKPGPEVSCECLRRPRR